MDLKQITVSDRDLFREYAAKLGQTDSESSFTTAFLWQDYFKPQYLLHNNTLTVLSGKSSPVPFHTFPLGDGSVKETMMLLRDFFLSQYNSYIVRGITEKTKALIEDAVPGMFEFEEKRSMGDYVYNTDDLIHLAGKKYHSKRNHVNRFESSYNWAYSKIDKTNLKQCAEFVNDITIKRNPDPTNEINAMNRLFSNYFSLGVTGACLTVDGQIVAVTVGERLFDTALIQVEKADTSFDGAYAAINRMFLKNEFSDCRYVNREEDMGNEGLRKAKMSYHPAFIYTKYIAKPIK